MKTSVTIRVSCDRLLNNNLGNIKTEDEFLLFVMDKSLILSCADDVLFSITV